MKTYRQFNGTSYDERTPDAVIRVLENARLNRTRLHISLGETDNDRGQLGRDWLEENDVYGFIGRSTGSIKIPLLVHNRRSRGGPGLLDHCIVRIRLSAGSGRVLYQHPNYHFGTMEIRRKSVPVELPDGRTLTIDVLRDNQEQAAFESMAKAVRYIKKLGVVAPISA